MNFTSSLRAVRQLHGEAFGEQVLEHGEQQLRPEGLHQKAVGGVELVQGERPGRGDEHRDVEGDCGTCLNMEAKSWIDIP